MFLLFTPDFEFHVKRAHRVDKNEQKNGIFRAIQIANAPGKRNDGEMNQIWVERSSTDAAHKRDAEEPGQKALAREQTQHKHTVNENREAMMHKVIVAGICTWAHEEKAPVQGHQQERLGNTAHEIFLEEIEHALVIEAIKNHAKQVFKNANWRKHVEKAIFCIEAAKPEISRRTKHHGPKDSWNKHGAKQHPKRAAILPEQPTAEPRRNRIAQEKARQRPRRLIQFHAEIRNDRPREREVHQEAPPRMEHLRKPRRSAIAKFRKSWHVRISAELEHDQNEHE